jgi:hypothetical protein
MMNRLRILGATRARAPRYIYKSFGFLLWIAVASGASVVVGEMLINRIYFKEFGLAFAGGSAAVGNIAILSCFLLVLVALINRLFPAILIGLGFYALLILGDILKLVHFDNPARPTDLQYLRDLEVVAKAVVNVRSGVVALAVCGILIALIVRFWKKGNPVFSLLPRIATGMTAACLLISLFILPSFSTAREWLNAQGIELPEWWQFEPSASARLNGLLVEWAMSAGDLSFRSPEGYTRTGIEGIARAYAKEPLAADAPGSEPPPNLIVFIIESFMDPLDLNVRFTSDPIPTFHAISRKWSSGKIVVPVFGGTSVNTEFELLTGLSMYFLPESSCPYRQYINHDIPSLPRLLDQHGYRTIAIPADPPYLFSRRTVFPHLGFNSWTFPEEDPETPRTADDVFAADDAIVDETINAARAGNPFFVLAFTGGTHYPWDYPDYRNSPLDLIGPMAEPERSRLKTYINALRVADNALKKLIAYFEKVDQRTVILVMGDHKPPLAEIYEATHFFKRDKMAEIQQRYQVPMVLWSNYPTGKKDFVCSANFIPVHLLQTLGLRPEGVFAFLTDFYSRFPVFSKYVQTVDGQVFLPQSMGLPFQRMVQDYRLIQYDLLMGKQYALAIPVWSQNLSQR